MKIEQTDRTEVQHFCWAERIGMEQFVFHLREEHRVKLMCDYAYVLKYGKVAIVAPKVWLPILREHEELLPDDLAVQWVGLPNAEASGRAAQGPFAEPDGCHKIQEES